MQDIHQNDSENDQSLTGFIGFNRQSNNSDLDESMRFD